jgi:hypothetical protein
MYKLLHGVLLTFTCTNATVEVANSKTSKCKSFNSIPPLMYARITTYRNNIAVSIVKLFAIQSKQLVS